MNKILSMLIILTACMFMEYAWAAPGKNQYQKTIMYADKAFEAFDFKEAIRFYEEADEINRTKSTLLKLAECYHKLHMVDKAIARYEEAGQVEDLSKDELLDYGNALIDAGRYQEAREILKDHVEGSNWVQKKVAGISDLESFFQYKEGYEVKEASFNTEESEFSPVFYQNGLVIVASRAGQNPLSPKYNWDNSGYLDLFEVDSEDRVVRLDKKLNTPFHEGPATFFDNDSKVIFTRNQFEGNNTRLPGQTVNHLKLFYSEKNASGKWKSPKMLPFNKEGYSFGHPSMDENTGELYFASNMEGGKGGTDLYKVSFDGEQWSTPVLLEGGINTEKDELFPFIQGGTLYFASEGLAGLGGLDVFKVDLTDTQSEPVNLGAPVNTRDDDFGFVWSPSSKKGYFSSNREGGSGKDDIYEFTPVEHEVIVQLSDDNEANPSISLIELAEQRSGKNIFYRVEDGEIHATVIRGTNLGIHVEAEGYETLTASLDTRTIDPGLDSYHLRLRMKAVELSKMVIAVTHGEEVRQVLSMNEDGSSASFGNEIGLVESCVTINNIYFDLNQSILGVSGIQELDKLIEILQKSDELSVHLTGYADPRGARVYNQKLSEKRAEASRQYLIEHGVDESRITSQGLGELNASKDCSEDCYQALRRTEIELRIGD